MRNHALVPLALAMTMFAATAKADDTAPPSYAETTLTGDWHGYRNWLRDHGVTFTMSQTSDVLGNVSGGLKRARPMTVSSNCRATSTWVD